MLEKREFDTSDFMWRVSTAVTIVSGVFAVITFILLMVNYTQIRLADPVDDTTLTELRQKYASLPAGDPMLEVYQEQARKLDLLSRRAIFTSQYQLNMGGGILLGSIIVFLIAFKSMVRWRPNLPELAEKPQAEIEWELIADSRQMLLWLGVVIVGTGFMAAYFSRSELDPLMAGTVQAAAPAPESDAPSPASEEPPGQTPTAPEPSAPETAPATTVAEAAYPTWEEMQVQWPSFRGPGGNGIAHFTNAPTEWDVEAGTGVKWRVEVPLFAANSPVVWGNRVFLSGADAEHREIYGFDAETGDLLWTRALEPFPGTPAEPPKVTEDTGYAAPTMVAHGDKVYALFANGDLAACDFDGNMVWGLNLGVPDNHYGHGSSLMAYDKYLYIQYDDNKTPRLITLDPATGEEVWVAERTTISWATPIVADTPAGMQVILADCENLTAYKPDTGELLWSHQVLGGEVAPSPAYNAGVVFAAEEYAMGAAIRIEASGETKVLWEWDDLLPEIASPVGDGERFYFGTSVGDLVCVDVKSGEGLFEEVLGDGFSSSPILVGDRLYAADIEGNMFIVRASGEYELMATLPMGEPVFATPAFMDGRIYARTSEHLMCIGQ